MLFFTTSCIIQYRFSTDEEKTEKNSTGQVQTYWGERMLGARTRSRRAAKLTE